MSTEVSEAAVDEVGGALGRNLASYTSQQWVETATALVRAGGNQAAAQLAPGETVEWLTPGIVHRYGKVWPEAVLLVTPHRLIVSASRGSIRTKREVSSLYRGPESLVDVSHRLLPGTNADHWVLEIATQQGPFLFAIPNFVGSDSLAQITGTFITGRARYAPETGTLVDGVPWGAHPGPQTAAFDAARADLVLEAQVVEESAAEQSWAVESVAEEDLGGPPTEAFTWPEIPEQRGESDPFVTPAEFAPPDEVYTAPVVEELDPDPVLVAAAPGPDWYPDPLGEAGLRYWDGQAWTHSTAH